MRARSCFHQFYFAIVFYHDIEFRLLDNKIYDICNTSRLKTKYFQKYLHRKNLIRFESNIKKIILKYKNYIKIIFL